MTPASPVSGLTKKRLEEMLAGLEGVTPGPWWTDSDGGDEFRAYAVFGPHERYGKPSSICDTHNAGEVMLEQEDGKPWDEQGRKNLNHLASCDPDTIRSLVTLALEALSRRSTDGAGVGVDLADKATALERSLESEGGGVNAYLRDDIEEAIRVMRSAALVTLPPAMEATRTMWQTSYTGDQWHYADKVSFSPRDIETGVIRNVTPLFAQPPYPGGEATRYSIEHDGFVGTVIGHYTRLDGKTGVVMQQDGTNIVHVYGTKWLKPAATSPAPEQQEVSEAMADGMLQFLQAPAAKLLTNTEAFRQGIKIALATGETL